MINLNDAIQALDIKNFAVKGDVITEESFNETYREFNVQGEVSMEIGEPTITWSQVKAKYDELKADYDNKQYQRDRASAYPSTADQLDTLYHQGIDGWKAEIKKVKDQFPKPE
jgi:hypothetical protein|tara:strand:- start:43 stop:381 length:339 start_codon:yes stop_codon:yes gene_type:complete